jgi:hypothetical protein
MLKRCAAAKYVVCGGCHESFRRLLAHINKSTVCCDYYCTAPNEPLADSGIQRSQRSRLKVHERPQEQTLVCAGAVVVKNALIVPEDNLAYDDDLVAGSITHFNASGPISLSNRSQNASLSDGITALVHNSSFTRLCDG